MKWASKWATVLIYGIKYPDAIEQIATPILLHEVARGSFSTYVVANMAERSTRLYSVDADRTCSASAQRRSHRLQSG